MYDGLVRQIGRLLARDPCVHTTCPSERTRPTFACTGGYAVRFEIPRERTRTQAQVLGTRRSNADHVPVANVFIISIPFCPGFGSQGERSIPSGDVTLSLFLQRFPAIRVASKIQRPRGTGRNRRGLSPSDRNTSVRVTDRSRVLSGTGAQLLPCNYAVFLPGKRDIGCVAGKLILK